VRSPKGPRQRVRRNDRTGSIVIRRLTSTLVALATIAVSVGCSSTAGSGSQFGAADLPATTASQAPIGATMSHYYDQQLSWRGCGNGLECATLTVPLDYRKPAGKTLGIAVVRKPSSGTHLGSLIVNPGGPGGSGVSFVADAAPAFSQLTDNYDLVSFDPRGVGRSVPIRCVSSAQLERLINLNPAPTTQAGLDQLVSADRAFADACYARNGSYLEHVGTIDQARDMDVLRAALGDRKLTYYGASYGTYLGAKYAQLFPTRIRAMVLDGAVNPDESSTQENLVQAKGFETDLHDMLASCANSGSCPLGSTEQEAYQALRALEGQVAAHPLQVGDRVLGPGEFFQGLAAGLYATSSWRSLWTVLGNAQKGDGKGLLAFADSLNERNSDGSYSNLVESNMAINCIDRPAPRSVASYTANAKAFAKQAPDFGAAIEYGALPCAFWRVPPVEQVHPVHAAGAPPILVIGTTRDPATPYVWAQALARQLKSGVLLTHDGDGHTAYLDRNECVDAAVKAYVDTLTTPAAGTTCR
jgi:pimeloyl-ACP methyl ester carboxylesterase